MDTGGQCGHVGLRIVLLGAKESGKSSAGNTILGKQVFTPGKKTVVCEKGQGDVAGRPVTVVDTPGWISYFPVEDSPELLKDQIVGSVSLCPTGPHALLLVINLDSSFQEKHRRAVQEHLELLGGTVWRHTILLFTFSDNLGELTIEQHIQREGQAIQWLIERCGKRYHVLSSKNRSEVSQVSQLLEMIQKMVAGNGGSHFHMERKVLQEMEDKRRIAEERANERVKKAKELRQRFRDLLKGETRHPSELRMVLLGWVAGGKSSTGNTILGKEEFESWRRIMRCVKKKGEVNGRQVTVVDTPGWWKFMPAKLTPDWIREEVVKSLTLCYPGPHVILLVIPADTSFKEEQRKIIQDNTRHLGEGVWRHTLVLFTWGERLGNSSIEQHIEREGQALRWLIEKCGNRYHVLCNMKKEDHTQVTELLEKIEEMVTGNTVFHLKPETQSEMVEEIEEMDRETRGGDVSTQMQKVPEMMQVIDELWIRREERLLADLGLGTDSGRETQQQGTGGSRGLPPANFQKIFEKEWSRREAALMRRWSVKSLEEEQKVQQDRDSPIQVIEARGTEYERRFEEEQSREYSTIQEPPTPSGRRRSMDGPPVFIEESPSEEKKAGWGSLGGAERAQKDSDVQSQAGLWTTEEGLVFLHNEMKQVFEKEWYRKEYTINEIIRAKIKSYLSPPAGVRSLDYINPSLKGATSSEPDTTDVAVSCMKVYDWMREKHSGNSSGYGTSSEMSNTETSDLTERDEGL